MRQLPVILILAALALAPVAFAQQSGEIEQTPLEPIIGDTNAEVRVVRPGDPPPEEAEDPDEPKWKRERKRRFRRVPKDRRTLDYTPRSTYVPIPAPETNLQSGAMLRQLDKMTGQTVTYEMTVGEERKVERLRLRLEACRAAGDDAAQGTMAFLKIWDTKKADAPEAFSGWMFAESPALSALDHPRYDVWVISCTKSVAENAASTE